MMHPSAFTLVNPQNGNLAFKLFSFEDNAHFDHIQRNNYFSLIWVQEGAGRLKADFAEYDFGANTLFAFSPYQPYMMTEVQPLKGVAICFHSEFFCIFKHHKEITCNGVLYNNIYSPPFVQVDQASATTLQLLVEQVRTEMQRPRVGTI